MPRPHGSNEAESEDEVLYPIRGKSCSTLAMPSLGEKFTTYRDFALASLHDIYTPDRLQQAARSFKATTLESGILLNDGAGGFRQRTRERRRPAGILR